ncbi:MAG TPA: hypothetical protein VF599_06065 [Pyrinomonadaceae bacterium]|jgi:hypothetical protein
MDSERNPNAEILKELYELGKNDLDSAMGGAMMVDILNRKDCPPDLPENAFEFRRKFFLRKVASRRLGKEFIP